MISRRRKIGIFLAAVFATTTTIYLVYHRLRATSKTDVTSYGFSPTLKHSEADVIFYGFSPTLKHYAIHTSGRTWIREQLLIPLPSTEGRQQAPSLRRPARVSRYAIYFEFLEDIGLGNQMFSFAAAVYVAALTRRKSAIMKGRNYNRPSAINHVFLLDAVKRFDYACPCLILPERRSLGFQDTIRYQVVDNPEVSDKSIIPYGRHQSWKYTSGIELQLRRHFLFKPETREFVDRFFEKKLPTGWNVTENHRRGFVRVGIHVRRGDFVSERNVAFGFTVPNETYFRKSMNYFVERYARVQFIVASNDLDWTRKHVTAKGLNRKGSPALIGDSSADRAVDVTYSVGHSAGQDLALLSHCDHVIVSTGTFGWWAAWLANGTTIYYRDWPRPGSKLEKQMIREDYFPPHWLPMTN